jgi:chaperonin GroEL (HSP60 family)
LAKRQWQIFKNAGAEGAVIVGKLLDKGEANYGFDAQSGTFVDMVKAGMPPPGIAGALVCGIGVLMIITSH